MVPEQAVLQRSDGSVSFVVQDDERAERRNVRLGVFRNGMVAEVLSGVEVGERVIVRGMLASGRRIRVDRAEGRTARPSMPPNRSRRADAHRFCGGRGRARPQSIP